ncbi:MAG: type II secretion system F family protein [Candidatus Hydrothermales bacterium]
MPTFIWKGRTPEGKKVEGEMTADTQQEVISALRKRNIIPVSVTIKEKKKIPTLEELFPQKVKITDMAIFTKQFATMLEAGLPLMDTLNTLYVQTNNKTLKRTIGKISEDLEGGYTLADAMRKHKNVFPDLYVNMVEAGEKGGALGEILTRLAEYLEKTADLQRKIKGAMIYPVIVIFVAIAATAALLIFVIPTFKGLYEGFGAELPLLTKIVIGLSNFVQRYILFIILLFVGIIVGLRVWYGTDPGREVIDRVLLRLPIIGNLVHKQALSRFSRTLSTLLRSGVPLIDSMDITSKTTGNRVVQHAIERARNSIREGSTISLPLQKSGVFPPLVVQMVHIGEQSGNLDEMLLKVSEFYDKEVDAAVEALTSALEPLIMVVLGGVVGTMVVSMYLPIFKLIPTLMQTLSH